MNDDLPKDEKISICQSTYLNNRIEQDHRFIKKRTKPILGFKNFHCAKPTIAGIESIRMIQKSQIVGTEKNNNAWDNFTALMA